MSEGDLVFDVGSHLGDRSLAFASLGAKVISMEPQPLVNLWQQWMIGHHPKIILRKEAVGSASGVGHLSISDLTPTVSTIAESWKEKIVIVNPTFRKVRWNQKVKVDIITLDELIVLYGVPTYCKIDVEGYEGKVLQGLSHPIKLVSFEFIYGDLESTISCVELLETLGVYEFNIVIGENRKFQFSEWVDKELLLDRLSANQSSSGDLYARLM
jgi:FkbM family methyltransferase